ncbi:Calmodulin [Amphibalanus amphitrite]|uniref:Calmodulin n=1 Tax=Amphibalanus amphitrite TaxID=1232801 RepID=A0A6A4XHG8_AMPAM|nr:neo-calmodulin-like [Amphibalanus amphitrite]XP_043238482.1 neo-calmodulin-like [Amphibalanus amphitrite]KAF0314491.1 Calmodulin [Amphibalanus amphitrite]
MSPSIASLPVDQVASLRRQFDLLDTDEDGHISPVHLTNVLRSIDLHITDTEMDEVMAKTDVDGDGIITFEDFVEAFRTSRREELAKADHERQANLRQTFQIFDRRNFGTISPKDIWNVMRSLGKNIPLEDIEDIVAEIDQDGDSRISYSEFVQCVFADDE